MDLIKRQLLSENIDILAKSINFEHITQFFLSRKIFTKSMIDHLKCYPDPHRVKIVLSDLQTRGPKAFDEFVNYLKLTDSITDLKIVSSESLSDNHHPHNSHHRLDYDRTSQDSQEIIVQTGSKSHGMPNKGTNLMAVSHDHQIFKSTQTKQSYDTLFMKDQNEKDSFIDLRWHPYSYSEANIFSPLSSKNSSIFETNLDTLATTQVDCSSHVHNSQSTLSSCATNTMVVKLALECHDNPLEDYKMTAQPRGQCLIINNIEFDSDLFHQRKGSEHDGTRLSDVFKQLGFEILHERNLGAKHMKKALKRVRAKCKTSDDALIIIILSHGSDSGIYGSDGIELDFNYIIDLFDNRHCKMMIGKPKIFIVQACRGNLADYGENNSSESSRSSSLDESVCIEKKSTSRLHRERPPPFKRVNKFSKDKLPTRTDMLFCFSCLPGYVSVRNEVAGSWLGVSLSYYLITESWDKDILRILAMVSGDIKGRISSDGHVEAIETTCLGWSKYLYFNPGIYK